MSNFPPKPKHKFTFGLGTVGSTGREPFGGSVGESKSPAKLVHLLAGVGAGVWEDVSAACDAVIRFDNITLPEPSQDDAYRTSYPQYQNLYPVLKICFEKMA
jgi:hypothetical protein